MNLNQQSSGATWETHKALMQTTPPIVDCGVHYVDVMCQITDARPLRVSGMGLRLSDEIAENMYNYGQFQVVFEDGSVGCYEPGWGPMMSEVACFVTDVVSPRGAVSILSGMHPASDSVDGQGRVSALRIHRVGAPDRDIDCRGEPGHQALCDAEQAWLLRAIAEDIDLTVETGEFAVFVGPSGCAKSTLLRVIAGLEDASSGSIRIGGRDVT